MAASDARREYPALVERVKAAAAPPLSCAVYGQQATLDGTERYDLLIVRVPASSRHLDTGTRGRGAAVARGVDAAQLRIFAPLARPKWRVLLNGGTHGDEPGGVEAVVRFLEQRRYAKWRDIEFTVLPCSNPWGYTHHRREGPGGADLNRSFRRARRATGEVSLLKRALRRRAFDMLLDCHEDCDAPGLYVFAPGALGRAIVDAVAPIGPIHPGDAVDGEIPLDAGVVAFDSDRMRRLQRTFTTWPLPLYVSRYHRRRGTGLAAADERSMDAEMPRSSIEFMPSATIETPTRLPLDQRVAMHHAALDGALATLK